MDRHIALTIQCAAVRQTIVLNLRRVQQGKDPKAVTDGVIDGFHQQYFIDHPELIDPAVTLLSKLRFPSYLTEEQLNAILAEMRDYFGFVIKFTAYCETRRTVSRFTPAMTDPLTILHSAMSRKD